MLYWYQSIPISKLTPVVKRKMMTSKMLKSALICFCERDRAIAWVWAGGITPQEKIWSWSSRGEVYLAPFRPLWFWFASCSILFTLRPWKGIESFINLFWFLWHVKRPPAILFGGPLLLYKFTVYNNKAEHRPFSFEYHKIRIPYLNSPSWVVE